MQRYSKFIYLFIVYTFLYLPIVVLVANSFNQATYSLLWHGFSLHWYKVLLMDSGLWQATWHSLILAVLAASIALVIGALGTISLHRYQFRGKQFTFGLIFILILVPDIVLGLILLILYNILDIPLGFSSLLLAHITLCIPFVVITLNNRLVMLDNDLFEAAQDLGATDVTIFTRIILPLLAPALISALLISFTLSLDDVIISYSVSGPSFQILPLYIYSLIRHGINPEINALCSVIFLFTLAITLVIHQLMRES